MACANVLDAQQLMLSRESSKAGVQGWEPTVGSSTARS